MLNNEVVSPGFSSFPAMEASSSSATQTVQQKQLPSAFMVLLKIILKNVLSGRFSLLLPVSERRDGTLSLLVVKTVRLDVGCVGALVLVNHVEHKHLYH